MLQKKVQVNTMVEPQDHKILTLLTGFLLAWLSSTVYKPCSPGYGLLSL